MRDDGAPGRVDRGADILRVGRLPRWETPLVVQVSRWDRLKDHIGVLAGFARLDGADATGARLVLAGPSVTGVADDPDGPAVLGELTAAWRALPHETRRRVQLGVPARWSTSRRTRRSSTRCSATPRWSCRRACRRASASPWPRPCGSGARWSPAPSAASSTRSRTVATACSCDDPTDPDALAAALAGVLADPERAARLGEAGHARVRGHLLSIRQLSDYARLLEDLG